MVLAERTALQLFILIITINGLHSSPRYKRPPLGILSEFIGKDSKSPLIVVVDTAPHARTLDEEVSRGHHKSSNSNYRHYSDKKYLPKYYDNDNRDNNYDRTLFDILRASDTILGNQDRTSKNNKQPGPYSAEKCTDESGEGSCSGNEKC